MGGNYSYQKTYACCEKCVKINQRHEVQFLNTGTPHCEERGGQIWIEVYYRCSNNHLFYTHELQTNYNNRVEQHCKMKKQIKALEKRIKELESIIESQLCILNLI